MKVRHISTFRVVLRRVSTAVFLLNLVFLIGCASVPPTLPPETRSQIERTRVNSYVPQNELIIEFMRTSYGAGAGLVGAIIDAGVASAMKTSADARAKKLQEKVRDLDVRTTYWRAISNAVTEASWLKAMEISGHATNVAKVRSDDVEGHAVLNLDTSYSISPDTRVLKVGTVISLYAPGRPKKPTASVLVESRSPEIGDADGDDALALWMADDGAAFRRAVSEAVEDHARLLRHGLNLMGGTTNTVHRPMKMKAKVTHGRAEFGIPIGREGLWGALIDETESRVVFRLNEGSLLSFAKAEVELNAEKNPLAKPVDGSRKGKLK